MKNPIKRQLRARRKVERIAEDMKVFAKRILSPIEIQQQKNQSFKNYYTFCVNVPNYKKQ